MLPVCYYMKYMIAESKTILITGARGGIGRDAALELAKRGYRVIATVHRDESIAPLKSYMLEAGVDVEVFRLDITDPLDQGLVDDFDIDVLINNAGVGESGSLTEIPLERVRSNFETNVFGTLQLTQRVQKGMFKRNSGRVIFISSVAGRITMPFWGAYNMTKFSLSAAAEIMRKEVVELTSSLQVSVVEPGPYHTGFNQRVMNTKYEWMDEHSYFAKLIPKMKDREEKFFNMIELQSTRSVVNKIVHAVERKKPRLRYTAPMWLGMLVYIARIFGK